MLSFSRTTGYAILALGCLESSRGAWVLSKQINSCTNIPMPYLRKILHALSKAGLVETKRGYHGGFRLARPAGEIPLAEVIAAVEGLPEHPRCLIGFSQCNDQAPCPLHPYAEQLREELARRLDETTVATVAEYARTIHSDLLRCQVDDGETFVQSMPEGIPAIDLPTAEKLADSGASSLGGCADCGQSNWEGPENPAAKQ